MARTRKLYLLFGEGPWLCSPSLVSKVFICIVIPICVPS